MLRILQQPYPLTQSSASRWRMSLLFGLFVTLFLCIFQPFGFSEIPLHKGWHAIGYGVVCTATMLLLNVLAVQLFPNFFQEKVWTTGKQILWTMLNIALIGLGNLLYTHWAFSLEIRLGSVLYFELITLGIGLFPTAASYVLNQLLLERRYRLGSDVLNEKLAKHPHLSIQKELCLEGENQSDRLCLPAEALLFLQAADNYVEVHYLEGERRKQLLLRGSLRAFVQQLAAHPTFVRCHKSFIVNQQHIHRISGNAQGYKLHLQQSEALIPVSRALNAELSTWLQA